MPIIYTTTTTNNNNKGYLYQSWHSQAFKQHKVKTQRWLKGK